MPFNANDKYQEYLSIVNEYLAEFFNNLDKNAPKEIVEAVTYSVKNGGKRVRPVLCLASADLLGIDFSLVKKYCIAIELIHSYSLVHDDLPSMDNDDYRRGQLSTHKKFGEAIGVLAGDALLNLATEVCLQKPCSLADFDAMRLLFDYSGYKGMIAGQVLDLKSEKTDCHSEQLLNDIYLNKTGKLLTAPILIPSILSNNRYYDELKGYGENLGMTFQIIDDIMDVEGTLESIGKTPNKDKDANKLTSVKIYGLDGAKQKAKYYFDKTLSSIQNIDNNEFFVGFAKKLFSRNS